MTQGGPIEIKEGDPRPVSNAESYCPVCKKKTRDGMVLLRPGCDSGLEEWNGCAACWNKKLEDPVVNLLVSMLQSTQKLYYEEVDKNAERFEK